MLNKEDFGVRIKKARELYGEKIEVTLTHAALARKIGVSRVYINDLEDYVYLVLLYKLITMDCSNCYKFVLTYN